MPKQSPIRRRSLRGSAVSTLLALSVALSFAGPARAGEWNWTITPYAWLSDVSLDATINDRDVIDARAEFGDLLSKVDMAAQVHLEGQNGKHGVFFDVSYMDLGNDSSKRVLPSPLPGTVELKVDLSMTIAEAGGTFDPGGDGAGVGFLYGVRIVDVSQEIDADFSSGLFPDRGYHSGGTLVDALIGVRYAGALSDRMSIRLRGDLSAGGTDLTWNAIAGLGYTFGKTGKFTALAGYRYMDMEFKEDDARAEVETTVAFSGPFAALAIHL